MMKADPKTLALSFCVLLGALAAHAQQPVLAPAAPPAFVPHHDPLGDALFPPELVMSNQRALGLSDDQKTRLREMIARAQNSFTLLQWQLQDAVEGLHELLQQSKAQEEQVLGQLDKVLDAERQIKRTQMTLMIRIKNELTPEQQARLNELRPHPPTPPAPPAPPHAPRAPVQPRQPPASPQPDVL